MRTCCQLVPCLALAACGGSPSSPPSTTATIQLDVRGGWTGTAEALVHGSDGAPISRAPIAGAAAEVEVEPGDTVTIAMREGVRVRLFSATAVQGGDTIRVVASPSSIARTDTAVHVPAVTGIDRWFVAGPGTLSIGSTGNGLTIGLAAGRTDAPVIAWASASGHTVAMYGAPHAAVAADGITLHDTVTWKPTRILADHAPDGAKASPSIEIQLGDDVLDLFSLDDGAAALPVPTAFGDRVGVSVAAEPPAGLVAAGVVTAGFPGDQVTLDLAVPALPVIASPTFDGAHLTWTAGGGGDFDAYVAGVSSGSDFSWAIASPPGTSTVNLPELPADLAAPAPLDDAFVLAYEDSDVGGYGAFLRGRTGLPTDGARWQYRGVDVKRAAARVPLAPDRGKLDPRAVLALVRR